MKVVAGYGGRCVLWMPRKRLCIVHGGKLELLDIYRQARPERKEGEEDGKKVEEDGKRGVLHSNLFTFQTLAN